MAVLEVEKGTSNLFKAGQSDGFRDHAKFNQYIPKNYFKVFLYGFPAL